MKNNKKRAASIHNRSIRTQLIFYFGLFVLLPLCLGLIFLNVYLQQSSRKNIISFNSSVLTQIRDNTDQVIEVASYSSSMLMLNENILGNLRLIDNPSEDYQNYLAKKNIENELSEIETSILNAVNIKWAILANSGDLIGSHFLSKTSVDYDDAQWYQEILSNGRKITFCSELAPFFEEMTTISMSGKECLYIGRSIIDYSGKQLGILLIQLSEDSMWGKFVDTLEPTGQESLYIVNHDKIQMIHNEDSNSEFIPDEILNQKDEWPEKHDEIISGTTENGFYYMAMTLEYGESLLVYAMPNSVFRASTSGIQGGILAVILALILFTVITLLYYSRKLSQPLIHVAEDLGKGTDSILHIDAPEDSYYEINQFVDSYNKAGAEIEELIENVKNETQLKEQANYEMLMSQISPHFIFNTVNSIRIMAKEDGDEKTEKALESLGDILHSVYTNQDGMTTLGQESVFLQSYVNIMQMRFGNSFHYCNMIPTELYYYEIPSFIMQPIVENAILHGVKDLKGGQIIINAVEYPDNIVISIFNNGSPMDKEKMDELLKEPVHDKHNLTGIGLYNVNSRLKVLYGETYGLIFNENVKKGFEIWICIPKEKTGGKKQDAESTDS